MSNIPFKNIGALCVQRVSPVHGKDLLHGCILEMNIHCSRTVQELLYDIEAVP